MMYFVILRSAIKKEVFLIDQGGKKSIEESLENEKDFNFTSFNADDAKKISIVWRKFKDIQGLDIREAEIPH